MDGIYWWNWNTVALYWTFGPYHDEYSSNVRRKTYSQVNKATKKNLAGILEEQ